MSQISRVPAPAPKTYATKLLRFQRGRLLCNIIVAYTNTQNDQNKIEKQIELKASIARVWRALTDYREFGEWFHVKLEDPFAPGQAARGYLTYPGYENLKFEVVVEKMESERL